MADKKIGELPVAEQLEDDALLAVYQQGETRSIRGGLVAQFARETIEDITVSAETLRAGAEATVAKSVEGNAVRFRFGLPRGEPGAISDCFDLVLRADGWAEKRQTAEDKRLVMAGYNYLAGGAGGREGLAAYRAADVLAEDMTEDGKMTFTCGETPTGDLTVRIYRFSANEEA